MNQNKQLYKLVYAAVFAALTLIATMVIRIPTLGTGGYINIGDSFVLLSAAMLGSPYGVLAAGIGSALADLLAGYGSYVIGTFIIKALMALAFVVLTNLLGKKISKKTIAYSISGIVAELIMMFGYFFYESVFLGYGLAAAASIISNAIQGGTCLVLGVVLINILSKVVNFKFEN